MRVQRKIRTNAFTLIELMLVLTVIGVLAAMAIPKYIDLNTQAKVSVCKGTLAAMRAAVLLQYYQSRIHGVDVWPTLAQIADNDSNTGSGIMQNGNLPDNPFSTGSVRDAVVAVTQKPTPSNTLGAWAYNPKTGEFWANTESGKNEVDF